MNPAQIADTAYEKAKKAYEDHFMVQHEIKIALPTDELIALLKHEEFTSSMQLAPLFKLFARKLFLQSVRVIFKDCKTADIVSFLKQCSDSVKYDTPTVAKTLVVYLQLNLILDVMGEYDLGLLINGSLDDTWCAEIAFDELSRRKAK